MKKLTHQQIDKEIESRLKAYGINVKVESGTQKKGHSTNRVFFLNGEKTFVYTYNDATNKQIGNPIIKAPAKNIDDPRNAIQMHKRLGSGTWGKPVDLKSIGEDNDCIFDYIISLLIQYQATQKDLTGRKKVKQKSEHGIETIPKEISEPNSVVEQLHLMKDDMDLTYCLSTTKQRRERLDKYFRDNVLGINGFCCRHYQHCRNSHSGLFYEGQLNHLGNYYDTFVNGKPFRIIVVGQEYGMPPAKVSIADRTSDILNYGLKTRFKKVDQIHEPRNPHMRGTTSVLRLLFGKGLGIDFDDEFLNYSDGSSCHIYDAFSLSNYLLCSAVAKGQGKKGLSTSVMKSNCLEHFRKTLEILEPTIIIVQGKGFWNSVIRAFDSSPTQISTELYESTINNSRVYSASFSHPSSHNPYNWGWNEQTQYLVGTVKNTIEKFQNLYFS